jgi:prevent-host-death family protein
MTEVGLFEAKTHLSRIVDRVEQGEEIVLTRHGRPVARIVPFPQPRLTEAEIADLAAELKRLAKGQRLDGLSLRELIEEGRH